ncbi:hypothetical protein AMTR_s00030p00026880 [Amborella trichopoda]|uniref:Uncharacterized protein n=1 Tax=Amborella trichopoda TaxID=13333 RepID=U5D6K0_AMBTC|nr:hypothetical protein AMTR_s00030p00026880 [Amborella trichopoda]
MLYSIGVDVDDGMLLIVFIVVENEGKNIGYGFLIAGNSCSMHERLQAAKTWSGILVPSAQKEIDMRIRQSRFLHNLIWVSGRKYEMVEDRSAKDHNRRSCKDPIDDRREGLPHALEQDNDFPDIPKEERDFSCTPDQEIVFPDAS